MPPMSTVERLGDPVGHGDLVVGRRVAAVAQVQHRRAVAAVRVLGPVVDRVDRARDRHRPMADRRRWRRTTPRAAASVACSVSGSGSSKMKKWLAVPNSALPGTGARLYAAVANPTAAATATVSSASTRTCWRHSRRNSRHAHRTTARRAATPPWSSAAWPAHSGATAHGPTPAEQRLGARTRRGLVDHAPVAQEHDPVGPRRQLGVVGHDDPGHAAFARGADQPHDAFAVDGVQRPGRLVGEQQPAVADHGAGDRHPLTLATRQLVGVAPGPVGEPELLERRRSPPCGRPGRRVPSSSNGSDTFSAAVSPASRLKSWNT